MLIRWVFAAVHLLALGIGLGAVWARHRALRAPLDDAGLRRVFYADSWWGVAALLWIATGLVRAFGAALAVVLALEVWPMTALIRWRIRRGRGQPVDTAAAGRLAWISAGQAGLVVLMVLAATAMARGFGAGAR